MMLVLINSSLNFDNFFSFRYILKLISKLLSVYMLLFVICVRYFQKCSLFMFILNILGVRYFQY